MVLNLLKSSFQKVKKALSHTKGFLGDRLSALFSKGIDQKNLDNLLEEMEEILFEADLGTALSLELVEKVRKVAKKSSSINAEAVLTMLKEEAKKILEAPPRKQERPAAEKGCQIVLIVGVNGSGKTTTIAKLARKYKDEGKKVMLAACDTFRAAATEQLTHWADKVGIDLVKGKIGADPASVAFDAATSAKAKGADVLLVDTAGRLQTKEDLMDELKKIEKTLQKVIPSAPHETWLILDANIGQNALDQVRVFDEYTPLTSLIITKLDGSAKGGILLAIYKERQIPIKYIGIGEKDGDLIPFDVNQYVEALF
ncbi:MAG: Signal recognition particle receptor FtsY [Chlamydiia bacterium]|nr:Signal recognition particle receptor FtsY [Chlamydiia bacterium]